MRRRSAIIALSVLAAAAGTAVALASNASAAAGCQVAYTANQWQGGFTANVGITNLGDALTSWTLTFTFPDSSQKLTNAWNATASQSGAVVTLSNVSYNGGLATNATVTPGFQGTWSTANPTPTSFSLNGVACNGSTTTGTPSSSAAGSASASATSSPTSSTSTTPTGTAPSLKVSGNKIVDSSGNQVKLYGVNRSGGEFACIQGNGMWDGPMDQASIDAMRTWKVRSVRVPLNEECWLGTSDVPSGGYSGATYQAAVRTYVNLLLASGITPIVEMHWSYGLYTGTSSGCSDVKATCQKPMPDAQYAPSFWTGVANAFKDNRVVFDLFNEPYPERATGDETSGWKCWRDGGTCTGITYQVAGFQTLVNSVRATGNTNVIFIGGLAYSNDLTQWLTYKPTDSANNLAAFGHIYNFNTCSSTSCFDSQLAPVAASVPLTLTEIGENDCGSSFINTVMSWADSHSVGYLAWTWNNWDCSSGPSLITDYTGAATAYGAGFKSHLATVSS